MRRLTVFLLSAGVAIGACGGDRPESAGAEGRPAAGRQPESAPADTASPDSGAQAESAAPGVPGGESTGAAAGEASSGPAGRAGEAEPAGDALYTVQVAAFTDAKTATSWTERLQRQDFPAWTSMVELGGTTYYRLRVGATPSVPEAMRLGQLLMRKYDWPVWVAPVAGGERVPDGTVSETRRVLGDG